MSVFVSVDAHLFRTPDGEVWTKTIYDYDFWKRYMDVFEHINIVSRIKDVEYSEIKGFLRSSGEGVSFYGLPMVNQPKYYLLNAFNFIRDAKKAVKSAKCCILRLPSIPGLFVYYQVVRNRIPFIIEVVVDPEDIYDTKKFIQKFIVNHLKRAVHRANGVSYVTQYALQEKYPTNIDKQCSDNRFETYYSSITLQENFFGEPRKYCLHKKHYRLIHIANNMNNYVKGHKETIAILKNIRDKGLDVELVFVGDGTKKVELDEYAVKLDVRKYITFTGLLATAEEIREQLMKADIFIFPTRAEGLPRVLIEAMAVGLPCLSTPVNGIPELLDEKYLFQPTDIEGFSNKIVDLVNNFEELNEMSEKNISKAREYEVSILQKRRNEFYKKLKELV